MQTAPGLEQELADRMAAQGWRQEIIDAYAAAGGAPLSGLHRHRLWPGVRGDGRWWTPSAPPRWDEALAPVEAITIHSVTIETYQ